MMDYTSTSQGSCARCGKRTPRSRLCKRCGRDERRESELRAEWEDTTDAQRLECTNCGATYEGTAGTHCPECDAQRCRRVMEGD